MWDLQTLRRGEVSRTSQIVEHFAVWIGKREREEEGALVKSETESIGREFQFAAVSMAWQMDEGDRKKSQRASTIIRGGVGTIAGQAPNRK